MTHVMSTCETHSSRLRELEGRRVSLAIADGSRFDDVTLVSAGRAGVSSVWLDVGGMDVFIHQSQVLDAWESVS